MAAFLTNAAATSNSQNRGGDEDGGVSGSIARPSLSLATSNSFQAPNTQDGDILSGSLTGFSDVASPAAQFLSSFSSANTLFSPTDTAVLDGSLPASSHAPNPFLQDSSRSFSAQPGLPNTSPSSALGSTPFSDVEGTRFGPGGRYALGRVIGYGGSSTVREGWDLGDPEDNLDGRPSGSGLPDAASSVPQRKVAIKIVRHQPNSSSESKPEVLDEPALWRRLPSHAHILPLLYYERFTSPSSSTRAPSSSSDMGCIDVLVMPYCTRGNLLSYVRSEGGRRSIAARQTPRLSRAGTLAGSSGQTASARPPLDQNTSSDVAPVGQEVKILRSLSLNDPQRIARARQPSNPFNASAVSSAGARIVTPSKGGSLPRDSAFYRLSSIPAGTEISPSPAMLDNSSNDEAMPYMGGGRRSPAAGPSPSTSFISRHGSIRSIGSTRSRQTGVQASEPASRGVPLSLARNILRQLCEALKVLHGRVHLVHGDLKLENVLGQGTGRRANGYPLSGFPVSQSAAATGMDRTGSGTATSDNGRLPGSDDVAEESEEICWRIADFGLSRRVDADANAPPTESLKLVVDHGGTLPYAAPELLRAIVNNASPSMGVAGVTASERTSEDGREAAQSTSTASPYASDMWALGCILYALLSGRLPFSDSFEPRLQAKIVKAEWEMPSRLRRARERKLTRNLANESSGTGPFGLLAGNMQARDASESPASQWSPRSRTASADQSLEVLSDESSISAFARLSRPGPSPHAPTGGGHIGGSTHSWYPNFGSGRRVTSPAGDRRMSSLSRVGRSEAFGSGSGSASMSSSAMFRGSSPLRESTLLDWNHPAPVQQDLSASMPALSPQLPMLDGEPPGSRSARTTSGAVQAGLQPSVQVVGDVESSVANAPVPDGIDSDAEEGQDPEWDGTSAERAAVREALSALLQPDPARRWTVEDVLRSRWLASSEFDTASTATFDPFGPISLHRDGGSRQGRAGDDDDGGVPASLLAIVEEMRIGELKARPGPAMQPPWQRAADASPSPLGVGLGEERSDPAPLTFERRPVSKDREAGRRASSLTRTRPADDDPYQHPDRSASRERRGGMPIGVPALDEGEERLGRLGRDGRPMPSRSMARYDAMSSRSRSTSRLLGISATDSMNDGIGHGVDVPMRGRGRRMNSPARHLHQTRSPSNSGSSRSRSLQRDSALDIVPLRSVSATRSRSRGFDLADLSEDDPTTASGSGGGQYHDGRRRQDRAAVRSSRPIEIPSPPSGLGGGRVSDSERSRSRGRSQSRSRTRYATTSSTHPRAIDSEMGVSAVGTAGTPTTEVDEHAATATFRAGAERGQGNLQHDGNADARDTRDAR